MSTADGRYPSKRASSGSVKKHNMAGSKSDSVKSKLPVPAKGMKKSGTHAFSQKGKPKGLNWKTPNSDANRRAV